MVSCSCVCWGQHAAVLASCTAWICADPLGMRCWVSCKTRCCCCCCACLMHLTRCCRAAAAAEALVHQLQRAHACIGNLLHWLLLLLGVLLGVLVLVVLVLDVVAACTQHALIKHLFCSYQQVIMVQAMVPMEKVYRARQGPHMQV